MIRYAGMILIAAACTACGFIFSGNIRQRLRQLEIFIKFFDEIIKYVEIYKYPVEKIFNIYDESELNFFIDKLRKHGRIDGVYKNPWLIALQECKDKGLIFFKEQELNIMKKFGACLGVGRAEEQLVQLNLYADKLKEIYANESERELNHAKLYRWSGGLVGLLICILLI